MKLFLCVFLFAIIAFAAGAAETMGLYQSTPGNESSSHFDTAAWSYTRLKHFNVQLFFGKRDIKIDEDKGKGNNRFFFELTRKQYEQIFESNKPVRNMKVNDHMWDRNISAAGSSNKRVVKISFTNAITPEMSSVFKRGRIEIIMGKNKIHSMKLFIEKKRFMGMFGYKNAFLGEASNLKRTIKGLALLDEGELGRVKSPKLIDMVLKDKSKKNFSKILRLQK
jgi:hypothetical protein